MEKKGQEKNIKNTKNLQNKTPKQTKKSKKNKKIENIESECISEETMNALIEEVKNDIDLFNPISHLSSESKNSLNQNYIFNSFDPYIDQDEDDLLVFP